ncbi:DUF6057 family protein [Draconibacterium halophilum]|uniref:Uncharacterized protein n=1 Tax=Draconibacterium halophilum TaxID=2706887 RepID=A0A6C0RFM4_9BACT|nr:DUF6057 family protein [Draconibacterium halophilum]QIA07871.1 hypothetical protein G0Q07_09095 [Draconibacterium halophilum]
MNQSKYKLNRIVLNLPYLLLLLLGTFYLFNFTSYIFYYQEKSSLFLLTFSYLQEHLNQPGGFLIYLGELQEAFYYYPLLGAVLVVLEICAITFVLGKIGSVLTGRRLYFVSFIIGALLFYLQTNYQYQAINNLGILIHLLLFLGVITSKPKSRWGAVIILPLIYFLFGSFSYLLLGMLSVYFLLERKWLVLAFSWLSVGICFWLGKEFLFYQTTSSLLVFPFSVTAIGGQVILFGVTALIVLFVPILAKIKVKSIDRLKIRQMKFAELSPFLIILLLTVVVSLRIDIKSQHYFHAEKLFYEQKYDELIRFNSVEPTNNKLTLFINNVALAETGRLGDSLFKFRQSNDGTTLFLKWENIGQYLRFGGYYYYAIGVVNEAQRWVYEYTVIYGYTPETLKMLIKTELIKGNYQTAEKYITILGQSLFYKNQARDFRNFLNDDVAVLSDNELGRKRQQDTKLDFFVKSDEPWLNLLPVLDADPNNPIALQYKLSWLMLQKDMKGIVELLPAMEQAGLKKIPKNVEEAVVTYKLLNIGEIPELKQLKIDPQTEQRFQRYYQIYQQNQSNKRKAQIALRDFADTYWYYVFFN